MKEIFRITVKSFGLKLNLVLKHKRVINLFKILRFTMKSVSLFVAVTFALIQNHIINILFKRNVYLFVLQVTDKVGKIVF